MQYRMMKFQMKYFHVFKVYEFASIAGKHADNNENVLSVVKETA